jgi:catechol 2,3-dioxygenase-like lactoylglutathione lyase family enzyme
MRTLHVGLRVSDLDRSLAFWGALIEPVPWPAGHAIEMTEADGAAAS